MEQLKQRVDKIEDAQDSIKDQVSSMEKEQSRLVEAVENIKHTLDRLVDTQNKFMYMVFGSIWGAIVIGIVTRICFK